MIIRKFSFILCIVLVLITISASAENWPQWRGPNLNGSTSESNLPTNWSKTENVLWVTKMPGKGNSTPIIWNDKIFITDIESESLKMWAMCLDRTTGEVLWKHEMGTGFFTRTGNNGAAPSPITDGKRVYFFFGNGNLVSYNMDGELIWERNIQDDHGEFYINFGYGASLLLYKNKLYMSVMHRHTREDGAISYVLCINPETGEDIWKVERDTDAEGESMESYTTPYPFEGQDGTQIIVNGADYVTAHDPENGKEIWRWGNLNPDGRNNFRLVPTVVSVDDIIIFCRPRGDVIYALKGGKTGELTEDDLLWSIWENGPDVCTPLVMDGKLYILDGRRRVMGCIDPETGDIIWKEKVGANKQFQASPTGADDKIYCISMGGEVVVLSAGDKFQILSQIDMGEGEGQCRSTISAAQGCIYIRTSENLYCIGNK